MISTVFCVKLGMITESTHFREFSMISTTVLGVSVVDGGIVDPNPSAPGFSVCSSCSSSDLVSGCGSPYVTALSSLLGAGIQ